MATETKGFLTRGGVVPGVTWGTPVAIGANRLFEYFSESISADVQLIENEQNAGSGTRRAGDKGNEFYRGDIVLPAKFETLDLVLAMIMGAAAAPVQQGGDTAYLHALSHAEDLIGKFVTLAFAKEIEVHEYDSVKLTGFDFESEAGAQAARITLHAVARKLNVNVGSGTNTLATMASATMLSARQRIFHNQLALLLNDQSGAGLAGGDAQAITRFMLSVRRPFVEDEVTSGVSVIAEPVQDGHVEVSGSITFRVYRAAGAQRFADQLAKTQKKATATYTGPIANGSTPYSLKFWLNALQFRPFAPSVSGPNVVNIEAPFVAHEVAAIPTGFTAGYVRPATIDLVNTKSSSALT
jgi:hypothetical protein